MALELGILVADAAMLGRALDLARSADEAQLFLMDDGVRAADEPRLRARDRRRARGAACARWTPRRAAVAPVAGGPRFGSQ